MPAPPLGSEPAMVSATGIMTSGSAGPPDGQRAGARRIGYDPADMGGPQLRLEVYESDAEAFDGAAQRVAERLRLPGDRKTVALSGGRGGRGLMLALAARGDVPWDAIDWFWGDERCVPPGDDRSNVRL